MNRQMSMRSGNGKPRILLIDDENDFRKGLATAFASSFAHILVIGTPNNAIVFSVARDPETGEQLLTMKDFFIHGSMVFLLSMAVLWLWVFFGYWRWFFI